MRAGTFNNFLIPFKKETRGISAEEQAKIILQKGQELIKSRSKGVGIIYSANYGQTRKIEETYQKGDWFTGTDGGNQAKVLCLMESLMNTDLYKGLQGILRILPITTMNALVDDHPVKPWTDRVHMEIVKTDLGRIKTYLEDGWDILGWQNQESVNNLRHPYAIGGGIARLPTEIANEIQKTLMQYALNYKIGR
jgi:hypothetical protein